VVFRSATEPFDTATPMGRMLVQMLGMFAQFERDTIIDRVIAGMERKAAAGKWKGGRRPFGYQVDQATSNLVIDQAEAAVIRLIFDSYTQDRLGARTIASLLNDHGHRTTTRGRWSAHQVLRVLSNRIYLGELSFRGITMSSCHPPVIEQTVFDDAQRILAARGEDHAKRAASGSDYLLTGLIRCPSCGSAMLGTRAHGKTKTYRYYSCYRRTRYDTEVCGGQRIDADAIEQAITGALTSFYRHQHDLIADAIAAARASHAAGQTPAAEKWPRPSTSWPEPAPRPTATWPRSRTASSTPKTSPAGSPRLEPGPSNSRPAVTNSPASSTQNPWCRLPPRLPRSPITSIR
jgi:site-specific DNA recombinase